MKISSYILLLFLIVFCHQSVAQPYQSIFGNTTTLWASTDIDFPWLPSSRYFKTAAWTGNDTFVNFRWYKTVFYRDASEPCGLIREDTMTGKVWYRSLPYLNKYIFPGDSIEKLVMDMSLQIGDTFEFGLLAGYYMAPVQTVTNVYVDQGRKHIEFQKQFSSNDKLSFIEGLSTSIGFVYKDSNKIIQYKDAYSGMLLCIYKDSMNVYRSPYAITGFPDACYPLNVNNIQPASPLSVYPNPSSGIFTINSPPVNTAIVVKDIDGRTVFEVPEQKQAKLSVDLTEYPKGVYFIQATSEYGSFYRKIVLR